MVLVYSLYASWHPSDNPAPTGRPDSDHTGDTLEPRLAQQEANDYDKVTTYCLVLTGSL